jgi:acyl carrier protein
MTADDLDSLTGSLLRLVADEIALDGDGIEADTDLMSTGLVDSLGVVQIVEWMEAQLGFEIDPGDVVLEHFRSVSAMVEYARGREAV